MGRRAIRSVQSLARKAQERNRVCIVCQVALRFAGWTRAEQYVGGELIEVLRCPRCGLATTLWEIRTEEELRPSYSAYSYHSEQAWAVSRATMDSLHRWVRWMEPFRQFNRWLDVGCGAGALIRVASLNGWQVEGTELSDVAASRLTQEGWIVHVGFLPQLALPENQWDVVSMVELIEHLADPVAYLRTAYRLLRPGGALFVTTPNIGSLRCRLFGLREMIAPPEHLWGFTERALKRLLGQVGFAVRRIWTDGLNPYVLWHRFRSRIGHSPEADVWLQTQSLRERALDRLSYRVAKHVVNTLMRRTRLGDSLKVIAVKS